MAHSDRDGLTLAEYQAANPATGHRARTGPLTPFMIAGRGQSNMTGRADVANCDPGLGMSTTFAAVQLSQKTSDGTTNPYTFEFDTAFASLAPYRAGGSPGMGPELSMGRYLATYVPAFASNTVYVDKLAINGSGLATLWLPTTPVDAVLPGGQNLHAVDLARLAAQETVCGQRLGAYVWVQGEEDARTSNHSLAYQANLQAFYDALIAEYPSLKFIFNKLHVDSIDSSDAGGVFSANVRAGQVAFAAANPGVVMVDMDDVPLPTSDVHFAADSMVTLGNRLAEATANALYPGRNTDRVSSSAPFIQAINEPASRGTGALSAANSKTAPRIPIHEAGDDLFCVVVTATLNAAPTTPSGWTLVDSVQSTNGAVYANLYVYRKRATAAGTTAPDIADTNEKNVALCFVVRGGADSPIDVTDTAKNDAYSPSALVLPSVTTTGANRLIISIVGGWSGDPNLGLSSWTNAGLSGFAEYRDSVFNISTEGVFVAVAAGVKTAQGATGAGTATPSNVQIGAAITIAVKP